MCTWFTPEVIEKLHITKNVMSGPGTRLVDTKCQHVRFINLY